MAPFEMKCVRYGSLHEYHAGTINNTRIGTTDNKSRYRGLLKIRVITATCRKNREKHTGANMVLICAHKVVSVSGRIPATERAYRSNRPYGLKW